MNRILITGANRGLGLGFTQHYCQQGWSVIATCRNPDAAKALKALMQRYPQQLSIEPLEVRNQQQACALAKKYRDYPIDMALNNAGVFGPEGIYFGKARKTPWLEVVEINGIAPLLLCQQIYPMVLASQRKTMVFISSEMGSIAGNRLGGRYYYRTSKAMLNAAVKSMAIDLADEGIIAVALQPGWVKTGIGGEKAPQTAMEAAKRCGELIDRLTLADSGRFMNAKGEDIPW